MKKSVWSIVAVLFLTIGASGAYAGSKGKKDHSDSDVRRHYKKDHSDSDVRRPKAKAVPEIDAASGTQALALVCGVLLIGAERLRRRSQSAN